MPSGEGQPFFTSFTDVATARLTQRSQLKELKNKIDEKLLVYNDNFYTQGSNDSVEVIEEDGPMECHGLEYNNNNEEDDDIIASEENPFSE